MWSWRRQKDRRSEGPYLNEHQPSAAALVGRAEMLQGSTQRLYQQRLH
jgi:hypothetical protein